MSISMGSYSDGAVSTAEYAQLQEALRNYDVLLQKGSVGTIQQGVAFDSAAGSELAPFVPQDLDTFVRNEADDDDDIVLSKMIPIKQVNSPLHEVVTVKGHGDDRMEGFFAEKGIPGAESVDGSRKISQIKSFGVQREVSTLAQLTTMLGGSQVRAVGKQALELEKREGARSLNRKFEKAVYWGDSSLNTNHFDGVRKQLIDNNNTDLIKNMKGSEINLDKLVQMIYDLRSEPNFGKPEVILTDHSLVGSLVTLATAHGRFNQLQLGSGTRSATLVYNPDANQLKLQGPGRAISIVGTSMLVHPTSATLPTAAKGTDTGFTAISTITATGTGSDFAATDAGTYIYKIVAIGDKGYSGVVTTSGQAVTSGQEVRIEIADAASASTTLRYYEVWRSDKDGAASTCKFMTRVAVNSDGSGNNTRIVDTNDNIPDTVDLIGLQLKDAITMNTLMGTMMLPLARVATADPFALIRFQNPHVVMPDKHFLYRNVATKLSS